MPQDLGQERAVAHVGPGLHEDHVARATLQGSGSPPPKPPELREQWMDKIVDLVGGVPAKLPPFREVNHKIKLIDPGKQIIYHLPKCPDALKAELAEKISRYTSTGWWVPTTA